MFAGAKVRETAQENPTREESYRLRAVGNNEPIKLGSQRHNGEVSLPAAAILSG
jgi:hypothetical protein